MDIVRTRRAMTSALALTALAALWLGTGVAAASGELALLGSLPAADEEVDRPPEVARAVFSAPVEPDGEGLQVHDASGDRVDDGARQEPPSPAVVEVPLPDDLPAGEYVASWSVRSADGETLEGSWSFTVLGTGSATPAGASDSGPIARGSAITVALLALLLASGGLWAVRGQLR
jgi:copper resistance protein C